MQAWIFDLDGTLTAPMHDFGALKATLGLPPHLDVLAGIAAAPLADQPGLHAAVAQWERDHIENAQPADGAIDLLDALQQRAVPMGIVTRNTRSSALRTLEVIGLLDRFADQDVLGRTCAPAKPAPDALQVLLARWGVPAPTATMVGDFVHDVDAGRAAGCQTIWIDHEGSGRYRDRADRTVRTLRSIL